MLDTQDQAGSSGADGLTAILAEQTDRLFAPHVTAAGLRAADAGAWPADAWDAVATAGLPLAMVGEEAGGVGLDAATAAQILRRTGYHALPVPLGETMIAQALWSAAGGAPVDGPVSLAMSAATGPLARVPWADRASHLLLLTEEQGGEGRLVLLPRAAYTVEPGRNLANEPRETVHGAPGTSGAQAARVLPAALAAALGGDGLRLFGAFLRAQQMTGAMERCVALSIAYANERKQFGKPIGRFQAVQHMLAVAAGESAAASAAARLCATAWGTDAFGLAVAVAKARCGEAAGKVAEICHQVHGAMGFTQEHSLHFFTRRLWAWRDEFGNEAHWQARIGRAVCGDGGAALWPHLVALRAAGAKAEERA